MASRPRRLRASIVALFAAATLFALLFVSVLTLTGINSTRRSVARSRDVQACLSRIRAELLDGETGQRGFLLTGEAAYLKPFERARASTPADLAKLKELTAGDHSVEPKIGELSALVARKMDELGRAIDLYRRGGVAEAVALVRTGEGKVLMDGATRLIAELRAYEEERLERRTATARENLRAAIWIDVIAGLGLLGLGFALFRINRDLGRREVLETALREETRFQQEFIGILSHDLRNPLAAITMAVTTLQRRGGLLEGQGSLIGRIAASAKRMNRMIEQLLDLTRARIGPGIPVKTESRTNLCEVVEGAVEELRLAHPEAELRLEAERKVEGAWDADRMSQVVSNLVANAILHGKGPIAVRLRQSETAAVLEVHNDGPPIPPAMLPHVFEPFQRASREKGSQGEGLGLGLFIAHQIVTAHGGRIDVRSADSEGTTFRVDLPAR